MSAYLHSATMVKAGVYLIARMTPVVGSTPVWTTAVTVAGAATMVVGAYRSVQETDLKRILAYSTLSALGVLTMLLGVGTREAIIAALVYLVAHAGYKGALFLVAGAIDHETGTRDISALVGLRRAMPLTALAGGAAALSMAGVPLTLGFVGKDAAYEGLLHATDWYPWLLVLMVLASVLLGLSGLIAGVLPFRGDPARVKEVHDPAWPLWLPPLLLAAGGLFVGVAPSILNGPLSTAATAIAGMSVDVSLSVWHGVTPTLLLSLSTLAAVGSSYVVHEAVRARTWKPRYGTEDLYEGALSGLNAVSRAIAPALHSASLRTYVMVIVATSVLVGGAALVTSAGLDSAMPRTSIAPHDVLIVLLIVGGAIAAAFARSTMSAVLSLGAVGYGVATMFLSFGAPDLAMTQFSVETLTVLIYVLVFRHFRGLGPLSSRLVRARDGLIAVGIGIFIGGLLLSVATTETPRRLQELLRRVRTDPGARAQHRQRHPGRFPSVRHTRRNHGPGNCGTWRSWAAAIRSNPSTGPIRPARDITNLPDGGAAADAVAPRVLRVPAAPRPQPAWWRLCRWFGRGSGVRTLRNRLRRAACAAGTTGQTFDPTRRRSAHRIAERCACRSSWPTVLDGAMGSRFSAARHARLVRRRRVSRRRGRGADDDLQSRRGVLRWRSCSRWRLVFCTPPGST